MEGWWTIEHEAFIDVLRRVENAVSALDEGDEPLQRAIAQPLPQP